MLEKKDEVLGFIFGEDLIHHKFRPFDLNSVAFIFFDKIVIQR